MKSPAHNRGVTLVELVVTIVIIAIAVAAVLGVLSASAVHSADNLVEQQAVLIAESYLGEILEKPFGTDACAPGCSRTQMAAVGDYAGLVDEGVRDQNGVADRALSAYVVRVSVAPGALGSVPANEAELVTVSVQPPVGAMVVLSGYRTQYP